MKLRSDVLFLLLAAPKRSLLATVGRRLAPLPSGLAGKLAQAKKRSSDESLGVVDQFPDAVRALLVEIVPMTVRSRLTASKSNTPPDDKRTCSLEMLRRTAPASTHDGSNLRTLSGMSYRPSNVSEMKYRMVLRRRSSVPFPTTEIRIRLTFQLKPHGRGPRAEADAARRLPHVSRPRCRRRDAVILVT